MNPRIEERLEKVKRTSRAARRVCFFLMILVALMALVTAAATVSMPERLTCSLNGVRQACSNLSPQAVAFFIVVLVVGVALTLTALYRLARLFQHYARGEIFTRASVREIRVLGYLAVAYTVFQFVSFIATLSLVAGGAVEGPLQTHAELPIGTAILAAFILLLSWIMDVGAEMREENELTV